LLDDSTWREKLYSNGWTTGDGSPQRVVSPADGQVLGTIGTASPEDVTRAARRCDEARRVWAALPHIERGAVLRKAGDLWGAHKDEIVRWLVTETGAIVPFAEFQVSVCAEECFQAAALASAPYGELLRSTEPRLSFARRVPVGVVGVI